MADGRCERGDLCASSAAQVPRRRFAGVVAIGEHDHVAHIARQIESAQSGSRKRRPGRISGRLHGGEAGFDALADHQHIAGRGEPHGAAAAWTEHHLLRIDRRLAPPITGKEGAMDGKRRLVSAACHKRHHRRPDAA